MGPCVATGLLPGCRMTTWELLTAGTCLDGQPYPDLVERLAY